MNPRILDLRKKEEELKIVMGMTLKEIRELNGIDNPFKISRELGQSPATLRNIEEGISFPTHKTIKELFSKYIMTPEEKDKIITLKNEMLRIRREIKELNKLGL